MRPAKDFGAFFVKPGAWGSAKVESFEKPLGSPVGEYLILVSWDAGDSAAYVGLVYYTSSVFLRKRIARACRVRCQPTIAPTFHHDQNDENNEDEAKLAQRPVEYWRYHWYRVFLPGGSSRAGYWHLHDPRHRRSELPRAAQPDTRYLSSGEAQTY